MRKLVCLAAGTAVLAAACTNGTDDETGGSDQGGRPPVATFAGFALEQFDHCDALLDHVKAEALERVGPYGLDGTGGSYWPGGPVPLAAADLDAFEEVGAAIGGEDDRASSEPQTAPTEGVDYSGTNVQETGVDEPDIVKTDGERLFAVANGQLHYVDLTGDAPSLVSSLSLPGGWNHELLFEGDRVFVMAQGEGQIIARGQTDSQGASIEDIAAPYPSGIESSVIYEVGVTNPERMTIDATQEIEGRYLTARVVDGVARVVVTSHPAQLDFVYPSGPSSEQAAEDANREIIDASTAEDWLPTVATEDGQDRVELSPMVDCEAVSHPETFSGFGMLTVLSVDLGDSLNTTDAVTVMADGETVYAGTESLYVATNQWIDPIVMQEIEEDLATGQIDEDEAIEQSQELAQDLTTSIHKFDISSSGPAGYLASGAVNGRLLNQFAMSEQDGVLRVATTSGEMWADTSESFVTTFTEEDGELVRLGQVGDMGKGEQIHSVRFVGDAAYVVTFRQTDPLYTIDLSDPASPVVTGELKILGYSAYLHPIGDGRLIGVGQDATEEGRRTGAQVSLFDVSDPANPVRLEQYGLGDGSSDVEWDHRAFLWWAPEELAVMPLQTWNEGSQFTGAVGLTVADGGIDELGRISHAQGSECGPIPEPLPVEEQTITEGEILPPDDCFAYASPITRAVVVGDDVLTFSSDGLGVNSLDTLAAETFLSWY